VTTQGVLHAAQRHLHPDQLRIVVVGDPTVIAAPLGEVAGVAPDVVSADRVEKPA
jgi:hypothetical protein